MRQEERISTNTIHLSPARKNSSPSFTHLKIAQLVKCNICGMRPIYSVLIGTQKPLIYMEHGGNLLVSTLLTFFSSLVPLSPQSWTILARILIANGREKKWTTISVESSTCLFTTTRHSLCQINFMMSVLSASQSLSIAGPSRLVLNGQKDLSRSSRLLTRWVSYS